MRIALTQNKYALIDNADYELIKKHTWHCLDTHTIGKYYAGTNLRENPTKQYNLKMHRLILGLSKGDGVMVDHINGNGLDNRRDNLRIVSHNENNKNRRINKNNSSGYKGVYYDKATKKYKAQINSDGKRYHLGYFNTAEEASKVREYTAKEYYGEYY